MKNRIVQILLFVLILSLTAADASAWNADLTARLVLDAASFSPNRLRRMVKKHASLLQIMAETSLAQPLAGKSPNRAKDRAVRALANSRSDPETALQELVNVSRFLLEAGRPASSPALLETFAHSRSCRQAEFDGIQYVGDLRDRIEITRRATEDPRRVIAGWAAGRREEPEAAEALATAYHVAVNDLADLMATLWKESNQDTANTTSPKKRIWHGKSEKGGLSLPKGFDPVVRLADYYRDLRTDFSEKRADKVKTQAPVPDGVFLFKFKGLKIISKEGQQLKNIWQDRHPEAKDGAEPPPPSDTPEPIDIRDEPRPDLPINGETRSFDTGKRTAREVVHKPLSSGKPAQKGYLDEQAVERVIGRLVPSIRVCYEKATQGSGVMGTLAVMFTVNVDGSVGDVKIVENTLRLPELGDCLVSLLEGAKFPPPGKDPVSIRYPFVFQ